MCLDRPIAALSLALSVTAAPAFADLEKPVAAAGPLSSDGGGWNVALRTFAGGNTNTQFFNDFLAPAVEQFSPFVGVSGRLPYSRQVQPGWDMGVAIRADALINLEDSAAPLWDSASDYSFF